MRKGGDGPKKVNGGANHEIVQLSEAAVLAAHRCVERRTGFLCSDLVLYQAGPNYVLSRTEAMVDSHRVRRILLGI